MGLAWLYPYDKTVWPQGCSRRCCSGSAGAVATTTRCYIHLQETGFDYQGFFAPTATPFVNHPILPERRGTRSSYSNQGEPVTVTLVFSSGGKAYGPADRDVDDRAGRR